MTAEAKTASKGRRIHWMDNLRTIIIYLVALYHVGGVRSKMLYIIASSIARISVTAHIFARLYPFPYVEGFEVTPMYRLVWHLAFYLSLLVMVYVMIESFRLYVTKSGRIWSELNRNSYGVYIIHVIIIGIFGTLLLRTNLPALAKYPLPVALAYVGSNMLVSLNRVGIKALTASREPRLAVAEASKG